MKVNYKSWQFITGALIMIVLIISYFIRIPASSGESFITYSKLLGILIFYNPFILAAYVLIAIILIFKSFKR